MWLVVAVLMFIIFPEITLASQQCGAPPKPAHGRLSLNKSVYDHGVIVRVTCESNYVLHGQDLLTCDDGKWIGRTPVCLRNIAYGHDLWFGSSCNGGSIPHGGKFLHPMCDSNERVFFHVTESDKILNESVHHAFIFFRGNISARDVNGKDVPLIRKIITFTRDPHPSNFITCPISESGKYFDCKSRTPINGAKVEVTLKDKNTFDRIKPVTIELRMENNGFVVASVSEVNCGTPPAPLNGLVSVTNSTEVKYECQPGYVLIGKAVQQCDSSNYPEIVWRSDVPTCLESSQIATTLTPQVLSESHIVFTAVLISVGCFMVIVTVVGVVWCCWKRRDKKQVVPTTMSLVQLEPFGNSESFGCEQSSYFSTGTMLPAIVQYPLIVSQNYSPSEYSSLADYQNQQSCYANLQAEPLYAIIDDSD